MRKYWLKKHPLLNIQFKIIIRFKKDMFLKKVLIIKIKFNRITLIKIK